MRFCERERAYAKTSARAVPYIYYDRDDDYDDESDRPAVAARFVPRRYRFAVIIVQIYTYICGIPSRILFYD